jgi:hypothetical protein
VRSDLEPSATPYNEHKLIELDTMDDIAMLLLNSRSRYDNVGLWLAVISPKESIAFLTIENNAQFRCPP